MNAFAWLSKDALCLGSKQAGYLISDALAHFDTLFAMILLSTSLQVAEKQVYFSYSTNVENNQNNESGSE